jgi:hypothetical protein
LVYNIYQLFQSPLEAFTLKRVATKFSFSPNKRPTPLYPPLKDRTQMTIISTAQAYKQIFRKQSFIVSKIPTASKQPSHIDAKTRRIKTI